MFQAIWHIINWPCIQILFLQGNSKDWISILISHHHKCTTFLRWISGLRQKKSVRLESKSGWSRYLENLLHKWSKWIEMTSHNTLCILPMTLKLQLCGNSLLTICILMIGTTSNIVVTFFSTITKMARLRSNLTERR